MSNTFGNSAVIFPLHLLTIMIQRKTSFVWWFCSKYFSTTRVHNCVSTIAKSVKTSENHIIDRNGFWESTLSKPIMNVGIGNICFLLYLFIGCPEKMSHGLYKFKMADEVDVVQFSCELENM